MWDRGLLWVLCSHGHCLNFPMTEATPRPERRRKPRQPDENWFGGAASAGSETPQSSDKNTIEPPASLLELDWHALAGLESEARFLARQAQRIVGAGQTAFGRIYLAFIGARAALGLALVLTLLAGALFGVQDSPLVLAVGSVYAALALGLWLLPRVWPTFSSRAIAPLRVPQWLATVGLDIACFLFLHTLSPASTLNYVALLVLPALMAGVLTPRLTALATVAGVNLVLLLVALARAEAGGDLTALMAQAALAGSGLFVVSLLAGEMAGRLAREELSAKGSLELARQQAQLNRLVIEEMQEGVLVVDRRGRVRTSNPAAQRLLAASPSSAEPPTQLRGVPAWNALVRAVERAFGEGQWPEEGRDVLLTFEGGASRTLRVRVRFTRRRESKASEELCVLFVEDVRSMQARIRQEKLAAMGRVSAGIAHEIRNPLAAISQANALMAEDAQTATAQQLTRMVTENVLRLKRIVDDVMDAASGEIRGTQSIDAKAFTAEVCREWLGAQSAARPDILQLELPSQSLCVVFDAEHLRRVLVNLLDNAHRHASGAPQSVRVVLSAQDLQHAQLRVLSDGAPITPDVEPYLFEPFFSTRSRGTGLGLYICRELCERYGGRIGYQLLNESEPCRNEFFVVMFQKLS
jgi:two-component system, NtrC family, sensor histidine kinase PilS